MKLTTWQSSPELAQQLATEILPDYLPRCRWFRSKTREIQNLQVRFYPSLPDSDAHLLNIKVEYAKGEDEQYILPIDLVTDTAEIEALKAQSKMVVIAEVEWEGKTAFLVDSIYQAEFRASLFEAIRGERESKNEKVRLVGEAGKLLKAANIAKPIKSKVPSAEQSNTAIIYNDEYFLKIFRKLEYGLNPDLELVRFLSEKTDFDNSPRYGGSILIYEAEKDPIILGMMQNKIVNKGDAWATMLEQLERYYGRVLYADPTVIPECIQQEQIYFEDIPKDIQNLISRATYNRVAQLGTRTAEMHIALASDRERAAFAPVVLDINSQKKISAAQKQLAQQQLDALTNLLPKLSPEQQAEAQQLLDKKDILLAAFDHFKTTPITAEQTRVHGDYHLGQVLDDGEDFYIIDFEGEPLRSIAERRELNSPFKDVAGMVRSLHYAAYGELYLHPDKYPQIGAMNLEAWAAQWFHYMSQAYLTAYFHRTKGQAFVPNNKEALEQLLRVFILEKAIYEVGYEMNARPDWLKIPLRGVLYELEE
ncbi:MAG: putative maltokinase [Bacteroidota bacterium]